VAEVSETRYATTVDGVQLAYQILGDGGVDIAFVGNWFGNIEALWQVPTFERHLHRLASFARVVLFDKRGTGLSDPVPLANLPTLEVWMEDLRAVLDAGEVERAAVVASFRACMVGALFAASHPERTSALVLHEPSDALRPPLSEADSDLIAAHLARRWGTGAALDDWHAVLADNPAFRAEFGRYQRHSASPGTYRTITATLLRSDIRQVLPTISVPVLSVHHEDTGLIRVASDTLLELLPAGKHVELPGRLDEPVFGGDDVLDEIEEFLTGQRHPRDRDRVLATVLFVDIVASTETASALGDRAWRELIDQYRAFVRDQLHRFRGREVNTRGDDFLATFDGPGRAIRCALAITMGVRRLGINVRSGLHTGEVDLIGDDLGGIAVHIGSRVSELAASGEVLVSRTVVDLIAGSGIQFDDRGEHELKGLPGTWRLYSVSE
jgi:class 3 adenylate cyclase